MIRGCPSGPIRDTNSVLRRRECGALFVRRRVLHCALGVNACVMACQLDGTAHDTERMKHVFARPMGVATADQLLTRLAPREVHQRRYAVAQTRSVIDEPKAEPDTRATGERHCRGTRGRQLETRLSEFEHRVRPRLEHVNAVRIKTRLERPRG